MQTAKLITRTYVECPSCEEEAFQICDSHRTDSGGFGGRYRWTCKHCGVQYNIKVTKDLVEIEATGNKDLPGLLLLKIRGSQPPVHCIVDLPFYIHEQSHTQEEQTQHTRYWLEEHTCPTNVVSVDKIIENGDADPHGVLMFVAHVPRPEDWGDDGDTYEWDELIRIFPQLLFDEHQPNLPNEGN